MQYICHTRFKTTAICGEVNIPAQSVCEVEDNMLVYDGKIICATTSENCHQYFANNDDGNGMQRGQLTQSIQRRLRKTDKEHQVRWGKVWADTVCNKYKRQDQPKDYWLWGHEFYNADIKDLKHIARLIGAKGG